MGCDIHTFVEVKRNGIWTAEPNPLVACYTCNGTGKYGVGHWGNRCAPEYEGKRCDGCGGRGKERREFYVGRNYDLFSILANVRNGSGFAGCRTGEGFRPIAMPREWPADVSKEAREFRWEDGHNYTYLTLREILDYDWGQVSVKEGIVHAGVFKKWAESEDPRHTYPESWSGGVSGPKVRHISVIEMAEYVKRPDARLWNEWSDSETFYTTIRWEVTYRRAAGEAWRDTVAALCKLGSPEDVRVLMFFDN